MLDDSRPVTHRRAVSYIDRSRVFYAAQGYDQPYRWASFPTVPFVRPVTEMARATVGVVTTAYPAGHEGRKDVYCQASSPVPESMFTADLSWDKEATDTDDVGTYLPLRALATMEARGAIGALGPRFYGLPTRYSQRRTLDDASTLLACAEADGVDVMVLVPL